MEWDESEGYIKRAYKGLKKPCFSTIQFDSTPNRLLAAGDDHMIKFWDMDNVELWTSTDANGELLVSSSLFSWSFCFLDAILEIVCSVLKKSKI